MRHSIRTRFSVGIIFLSAIIIVLAIFSGYYLDQLSAKTGAILKENYLSVVYARDMTGGISVVNHELADSYLNKRIPDTVQIGQQLRLIENSLTAEKDNITEPGEDNLVSQIDERYSEYRDSAMLLSLAPPSQQRLVYTQNKSEELNRLLFILSQMNGKALENKTDEAKVSSKAALKRMTILATLCFLVGISFAYSLISHFNQRILQLYSGIKELVASNFDQRLYFEGKDEFYEISLVFNEMAEKLKEGGQNLLVTLPQSQEQKPAKSEIEEIRRLLLRMKELEGKAEKLISRLEKNM